MAAATSDVGVIHHEEYQHDRIFPSFMQLCPAFFQNQSGTMAGFMHGCALGVERVQPVAVSSEHEEWLRGALAARSLGMCCIFPNKRNGDVGCGSDSCDFCGEAVELAASEVAGAGISSWGETRISGGRFLFRQLRKRMRQALPSSEHHHQTEIRKRKFESLNEDSYGALLGLIFHSDLVVSGMTRNYSQDIKKALRTKAGKHGTGDGLKISPNLHEVPVVDINGGAGGAPRDDGYQCTNKLKPLLVSRGCKFSPHVRSSPVGQKAKTKRGQTVEYSFLLSDFPQFETLVFMPPPLRHLSKGLEAVCQAFREESTCVGSRSLESCTGMQPIYDDMRHTSSQQRESTGISFSEKPCVVVPVVRNAAALGCLLRLLPSMDIRMQDLAWCHMLYLIGCSGNLQIIVSGWHPEVTRAWLSALLSLLRRAAFRGTGLFCHAKPRNSRRPATTTGDSWH